LTPTFTANWASFFLANSGDFLMPCFNEHWYVFITVSFCQDGSASVFLGTLKTQVSIHIASDRLCSGFSPLPINSRSSLPEDFKDGANPCDSVHFVDMNDVIIRFCCC
jgi:hypothetical protein